MHRIIITGKNAELGASPIQDAAEPRSQIEGFDAKSFPAWAADDPGATLILLTVLVRRIEGTVKAYAGIVPDTSRQDPYFRAPAEWVRAKGNPLRHREAAAIWPGLEPREYAA